MKIGLFPTCLVEVSAPEIALAVRTVLTRLGHQVVLLDDATCCGQPAWNSGQREAARAVATTSAEACAAADVDVIVVPSGSCTAMIRDYWPRLLATGTMPDGLVETAVARAREFTELLAELAPEPVSPVTRDEIVYHESCHMSRLLGLSDEPLAVVAGSGAAPIGHAATGRCCGFGGTFAIKFPELSVAMADEVLDAMAATDATTVTGCDLSCLLQLSSRASWRGLDLSFIHVAELAAGTAPASS